jgi:hypothetical protein
MKLLITQEQFNKHKNKDLIPLECIVCNTIFHRQKSYLIRSTARGRSNDYCSNECWHKKTNIRQEVQCLNCGKEFKKQLNQVKKFPNHFCCHSCSATYQNTHKTYGTRRSKLEIYLEEQIEIYYPQLGCLYNNKETIGSELDFYFPTLKLAIELNGILHYEPIYGQNKFNQIQNNDEQKSIKCHELGIEFCIIDSSKCKYLTQERKDEFWNIIDNILAKIINRHN